MRRLGRSSDATAAAARAFDVTRTWLGLSLLKGAATHQTAQNPDEDWCC